MRRTLTTAAGEAVRLRFAPSPTGALHAGGARTALFNYLFARKCELRGCDATFMVRIDDSDSSRTVPGAEEAILSDLAWLGMRFGAPARCSDRDYASTVDQLLETGHAYRDFGGDTNWRDASDAEVRPLLADGVPHAVRFRVPRPDHPVTHVVEDAVRDLRWADVRRTLRRNLRYDGALFDLHWKQIKVEPPKVFVICDVSGSVRTVSRFLLTFLYSLGEVLPLVRAFAFSNELGEVTPFFTDFPLDDASTISPMKMMWSPPS